MPVNLKFRMANFKLKCKFRHMKDQDNEYENCDPKSLPDMVSPHANALLH